MSETVIFMPSCNPHSDLPFHRQVVEHLNGDSSWEGYQFDAYHPSGCEIGIQHETYDYAPHCGWYVYTHAEGDGEGPYSTLAEALAVMWDWAEVLP